MRKRVYICSPFTGDVEHNVVVARALCLRALRCGYAPFAPHLFYPALLDDADPAARAAGLECALAWLDGADEVWILSGPVTAGMEAEIAHVKRRHAIAITTVAPPTDAELAEVEA